VNAKDVCGYTALHHCTTSARTDTTLQLAVDIVDATSTSATPVNANLLNRLGRTPLHDAARQRDVACIALLLECGADPDLPEGGDASETAGSLCIDSPDLMELIDDAKRRKRPRAVGTMKGCRVVLNRLKAAHQNGKRGVCLSYDPVARRYGVRLDATASGAVAVRPENLDLYVEAEASAGQSSKASKPKSKSKKSADDDEMTEDKLKKMLESRGLDSSAFRSTKREDGQYQATINWQQLFGMANMMGPSEQAPSRRRPTSQHTSAILEKGVSGLDLSKLKVNQPTICKFQVPLGGMRGDMMVYDQTRTAVYGFVTPTQHPAYDSIADTVRSIGIMGLKGYFTVTKNADGSAVVDLSRCAECTW
jgi:hypothetical protein